MLRLLFLLLATTAAGATWKAEYASVDPAVRAWYETRTLTEAAHRRFGFKSCCAHADVVKTRFRVSSASGADEWWWERDGQWLRVPDDIIHWDQHAPDNMPTLFAVGGKPVCFFAPGAGG